MKLTSILKITILMSALLLVLGTTSTTWAATFYVSKSGNDSNNGTSSATPFLTIQRGLNAVRAGDTVNVMAGSYNEALTLPVTGTAAARITLQNYNGQAVTINSGTSRTIKIGSRSVGYWTIRGLTLIATNVPGGYGNSSLDQSIDFGETSWWGWGAPFDSAPYTESDANGSNHNLIENCTITGGIFFMGHYNTVRNCVMDGVNQFRNGIACWTVVSHHNTFTGNKMTRYTDRAIWAMSNTSYITVTDNDISHWGGKGNPAAIDFDGARFPVYYSVIRNNVIHDGDGTNSMATQFENCMYCVCDGNVIYNVNWGLTSINYTKTGSGGLFAYGNFNFQSPNNPSNLVAVPSTANNGLGTTPYVTGNIFSNNVVYNTTNAGVELMMTWGESFYNNTFYNCGTHGAIYLANQGTSVGCTSVNIRNNIIANCKTSIILQSGGSIASLTNNLFYGNSSNPLMGSAYQTGNPMFVSPSNGDFSLASSSPAIGSGATIASVTADVLGNARPSGGGYDIGAYQRGASGAITPPSNLQVQ